MLLVNPVTRQQLSIPNSPLRRSSDSIISPALGYDSSTTDYKIVHLTRGNDNSTTDDKKKFHLTGGNDPFFVHVYSVKMGIWKRYGFPRHGTFLYPTPGKVVLNGVIHWLAFVDIQGTATTPDLIKSVISSFELAGEVFGEISYPGRTLLTHGPHVLGESLCVLSSDTDFTGLWVMKEYGVPNSWAKLASWDWPIDSRGRRRLPSRYEPLCLNGGDEEILMRTDAGALVVFNLNEQNVMDVVVDDGSEGPFPAGHAFVESLVSPMPTAIAE